MINMVVIVSHLSLELHIRQGDGAFADLEWRFLFREQLLHQVGFQFPQISLLLKKIYKMKIPLQSYQSKQWTPPQTEPWIQSSSASAIFRYDFQYFSSDLPTTSKESPGHPPPDSAVTWQHSQRAQPVPCAHALCVEESFQVEAPKCIVEAALWLEKRP